MKKKKKPNGRGTIFNEVVNVFKFSKDIKELRDRSDC